MIETVTSEPPPFDRIDRSPPEVSNGEPFWRRSDLGWNLLFGGRRSADSDPSVPPLGLPAAVDLVWAEQCHSATVLDANAKGSAGVGDALRLRAGGMAALIRTADCVPIALLAERVAILIHAGWRGLAAGLPGRAAERLGTAKDESWSAWIGPAIGPCCYEVDEEVAAAVEAQSGTKRERKRDVARPYLDLRWAAAAQLRAVGARRITLLDHCTRCRSEWLWSYRRDGERAGRNRTLLWREDGAGG